MRNHDISVNQSEMPTQRRRLINGGKSHQIRGEHFDPHPLKTQILEVRKLQREFQEEPVRTKRVVEREGGQSGVKIGEIGFVVVRPREALIVLEDQCVNSVQGLEVVEMGQ